LVQTSLRPVHDISTTVAAPVATERVFPKEGVRPTVREEAIGQADPEEAVDPNASVDTTAPPVPAGVTFRGPSQFDMDYYRPYLCANPANTYQPLPPELAPIMRQCLAVKTRLPPNISRYFEFNQTVADGMTYAQAVRHIRGLNDLYEQLDSYVETNGQVLPNRSLSETLANQPAAIVNISAQRERNKLRKALQTWLTFLYVRTGQSRG
jgi:hypothetical protein